MDTYFIQSKSLSNALTPKLVIIENRRDKSLL